MTSTLSNPVLILLDMNVLHVATLAILIGGLLLMYAWFERENANRLVPFVSDMLDSSITSYIGMATLIPCITLQGIFFLFRHGAVAQLMSQSGHAAELWTWYLDWTGTAVFVLVFSGCHLVWCRLSLGAACHFFWTAVYFGSCLFLVASDAYLSRTFLSHLLIGEQLPQARMIASICLVLGGFVIAMILYEMTRDERVGSAAGALEALLILLLACYVLTWTNRVYTVYILW